MKFNHIVLGLLLGFSAVEGINIKQSIFGKEVKQDAEEEQASTANELDALMDKYDNNEKKPAKAQ